MAKAPVTGIFLYPTLPRSGRYRIIKLSLYLDLFTFRAGFTVFLLKFFQFLHNIVQCLTLFAVKALSVGFQYLSFALGCQGSVSFTCISNFFCNDVHI